MATISFQIDIPQPLAGDIPAVERYREAAVAKWYEMGMISPSKACEILECSRDQFHDLLLQFGVSVIQVSEEDIDEELRFGR